MKRYALFVCAALGLALSTGMARADWGCGNGNGGYKPWWAKGIGGHRAGCKTPEEKRLQKFWHDYYKAMRKYYASMEKMDWVAYYKNHGQPTSGCGNPCRVNYAPVCVNPQMQWCGASGCAHGGQ